MNVLFISPNYPRHFYQFCARLKERGVNVLGIGDSPWDGNAGEYLSTLRYLRDSANLDGAG